MTRISHPHIETLISRLIPLVIFLVCGGLYLNTLYPGIGGRINFGDSVKFQFLTLVDGLPHSPGFPLYLMLSRAAGNTFTFSPHPERVALLSVLFGLLTILLVYCIIRNLTSSIVASLTVPLILAFSFTFWTQATEAEIYTLNTFFIAVVCWLFIRYERTRRACYLYGGLLLYAVSFGNHLSMIGLLPALLYLICSTDKRVFFSRNFLFVAVFSILLGMSQYLYIWNIANSPMAYSEFIGQNPSFSRFLLYISGAQFYQKTLPYVGTALLLKGPARFIVQIFLEFGYLVLPGIFSLGLSLRRRAGHERKPVERFLLLAFAGMTLVTIFYDIYDYQVYFLPSFLIFTLFLGNLINDIPSRSVKNLYLSFLVILSTTLAVHNYTDVKVKDNPLQAELTWIFDHLPDQARILLSQRGSFFYHGYLGAQYFKFSRWSNGEDCTILRNVSRHDKEPFYSTARDLDLWAGFLKNGTHTGSLVKNSWISLSELLQSLTDRQLAVITSTEFAETIPTESQSLFRGLNTGLLQGKGRYLGLYADGLMILERKDIETPFQIHFASGSELEGFRFSRDFSVNSFSTTIGEGITVEIGGRKLVTQKGGLNVFLLDEKMEVFNTYRLSPYLPGMGFPQTEPPIYKVEILHSVDNEN
ncbi:MAG: DUF2723 domain-containing protein [bacterium]|nr:DUF2723 domain-containing protein [bacterium]MDT8396216.1 DUF2723 domain-containing protein [bacterium]